MSIESMPNRIMLWLRRLCSTCICSFIATFFCSLCPGSASKPFGICGSVIIYYFIVANGKWSKHQLKLLKRVALYFSTFCLVRTSIASALKSVVYSSSDRNCIETFATRGNTLLPFSLFHAQSARCTLRYSWPRLFG